ncbi:hypothetical protein [Streptomyces sp. NPDC001658]
MSHMTVSQIASIEHEVQARRARTTDRALWRVYTASSTPSPAAFFDALRELLAIDVTEIGRVRGEHVPTG